SFSNARYALICERTHSSANVSTQKVSLLSSFAATLDTKRRLKFKTIINFFMIYVEKYQTITYYISVDLMLSVAILHLISMLTCKSIKLLYTFARFQSWERMFWESNIR